MDVTLEYLEYEIYSSKMGQSFVQQDLGSLAAGQQRTLLSVISIVSEEK